MPSPSGADASTGTGIVQQDLAKGKDGTGGAQEAAAGDGSGAGTDRRYIPLLRANAGTGRGRGPRTALPETVRAAGGSAAEIRYAQVYWSGVRASAEQLRAAVDGGDDIGLLVAASGLVVVDCDVKAVDGAGWAVAGGTARWRDGGRLERGTDDLRREVERLGHCMEEIAGTYRVATKSGGEHFYFRQNPDYPLTNRHHRHQWRVDVIASPNSWVAAPPTAGYRVLEAGADVLEMPDWLAVFLYGVDRALPALGAPLRAAWEARRGGAGAEAAQSGEVSVRAGESLSAAWARGVLADVAVAGRCGGWNNAVYRAARTLLEAGWDEAEVRRVVVAAAEPWNAAEARKAEATVSSAVRGHQRDAGREA